MSAPITPADREAWIAAAERDLASMRAWANELQRRWAEIQSDYELRRTVRQSAVEVVANV